MTEEFNGLSQSSISEHIRQLKEADIITGQQIGPTIRYRLNREVWEDIKLVLRSAADEEQLR